MAEIIGMLELGRALDLVEQNLQRKYLRAALRSGATLFKAEAKSLAPRRSGAMASKIDIKSLVSKRTRQLSFLIGIRYQKGGRDTTQDPGVYSKFVERGTKHMAAKPFMGPAFNSAKSKVIEAIAESLRSKLGDLVKRTG